MSLERALAPASTIRCSNSDRSVEGLPCCTSRARCIASPKAASSSPDRNLCSRAAHRRKSRALPEGPGGSVGDGTSVSFSRIVNPAAFNARSMATAWSGSMPLLRYRTSIVSRIRTPSASSASSTRSSSVRSTRSVGLRESTESEDIRAYVSNDAFPEYRSQQGWNRVPDHATDRRHPGKRLVGWEKLECVGKGLEQSCFAQTQGSVLFRVAESTVSVPEALTGDGRCRLVPFHPTVDRRIGLAARSAMTRRHQCSGPVAPGSPRFRRLDASQVPSRESTRSMKRIVRVHLAGLKGRQVLDGESYVLPVVVIWVGRWVETGAAVLRGQQEQASSRLRCSVLAAIHYWVVELVSRFLQTSHERAVGICPCQGRNVLHRNDIGTRQLDEGPEMVDELPSATLLSGATATNVGRERLTRGASHENPDLGAVPRGLQFFRPVVAHVLGDEP